jgi:hypothetical protein
LAAGLSAASVGLLAFALNNAFYMALGERAQLAVLSHAPCGVVKPYVGFVLEDTDAPFRSASEKAQILDLLIEAQDRRIALCYDARGALPYLGQAAASRDFIGEDEPLGRLAQALVIKRRDPALTTAAFQQYVG